MFKCWFPFFLLIPAWSQTTPPVPPAPPDCLSKPVTLGTVTITCTLLDATAENGATAFGPALLDGVLFQVKAISTDADVVGFRIGVTYQAIPATATAPAVFLTSWGSVGKSTRTSSEVGFKPPPVAPGFRFTFFLSVGDAITSIQVQETKVTSSQTF